MSPGLRARGVAPRLVLLLGGLAAVSTMLALVVVQLRIGADLREAATERVTRSARAVDHLVQDHLDDVARRWAAISRTPELRANLATGHRPSLQYYAEQLRQGQAAALVEFQDEAGRVVAGAGRETLSTAARNALVDATVVVLESEGRLSAATVVPLQTGERVVGRIVVVEPITDELLDDWSELAGARVQWHGGEQTPGGDRLIAEVHRYPGVHLVASTTYEAERNAIANARRDILFAGAFAVVIAIISSLVIARRFAAPILEMRDATSRLTAGQLDQRIDFQRSDEIGELGEAFNQLVRQLRSSNERLRRAQRLARFGNWYLDRSTGLVHGTAEFQRLLGLPDEPVAFSTLLLRIEPEDRAPLERAIARAERRNAPFRLDVRTRGRDGGRTRILHVRGMAAGEGTRIEASAQDVTERRTADEQIRFLSLHDPLTGLGNREYLQERLTPRLRRLPDTPLALVFIGVDEFGLVTETYGHQTSDELIQTMARRLLDCVRTLPPEEGERRSGADSVARIGEHRFALVLEGLGEREEARAAVERLLVKMNQPYARNGETIPLTASAGVALWPGDASDFDALLQACDTALHRAQNSGASAVGFYHRSMHEDAARRLRLAGGLASAIEQNELVLMYQPRLQADGSLSTFEALARWQHPEFGLVMPSEFVPIAESSGLIADLGEWGLREGIACLRGWSIEHDDPPGLSLNLSGLQLSSRLVDIALELTEGVERSRLEFEVTETAIIEDPAAVRILAQLRGYGFQIALDDFGTGYSSLAHLQTLPLDTVKLDRSFVRDIEDSQESAEFTRSVLEMCRALDLHCVVEGVETEAQRDLLVEYGADELQGFLFARPLSAEEAGRWIRGGRRRVSLVSA